MSTAFLTRSKTIGTALAVVVGLAATGLQAAPKQYRSEIGKGRGNPSPPIAATTPPPRRGTIQIPNLQIHRPSLGNSSAGQTQPPTIRPQNLGNLIGQTKPAHPTRPVRPNVQSTGPTIVFPPAGNGPSIRPGVIKPGVIKPGVIKPGTTKPGTTRPGRFPRFDRPPIVKLPTDTRPPVRLPLPPGTGNAPNGKLPGVDVPNLGTLPRPNGPAVKPNLGDKPLVKLPPAKLPPLVGPNGVPKDPKLADKLGLGKDFKPGKGKGPKPGKFNPDDLKKLVGPSLQDKLAGGKLNKLINSGVGKKFDLKKQFDLKKKGDVALQLGLHKKLLAGGGWNAAKCFGPIGPGFVGCHFGGWYCGPGFYPGYCWYPHWCGWVDWCWWDWCHPICDPRPLWCQPIWCNPCPGWVWWNCPAWIDLHYVACGTWIDAPLVVVPAADADLQLLAVRFVDPGHPEKDLGPRYRVWVRNNSPHRMLGDFNVMAFAANDERLADTLPQVGARVDQIAPGEVRPIDLRLPVEANTLGRNDQGQAIPFAQLHVLVDSHREVVETFEDNNGANLARTKILPVDPAAFSLESNSAEPGAVVSIAGEGFGPEPGQLVVLVNGLQLQAEVEGWFDLGVRAKLPALPLADAADAELVVIRGDGAAANPLTLRLQPSQAVSSLPPAQP